MKNKIYILLTFILLIQGSETVSADNYTEHTNDPDTVDVIDKPTITITFDDGFRSQYEIAYPILEKYGLVATTYITTEIINYPLYSSIIDFRILKKSGWEIGSHTLKHDDLTKVSDDSLVLNLEKPKEFLDYKLKTSVTSFSSPYGAYNDKVIEEVEKRYETHVNAWSSNKGINDINFFDPYNIHRLDVTEDVSASEVCRTVENLHDNEWFVILFHNIRTPVEGFWDNTPEKFEEIIKCIDRNNVDVRNVSEMYKLIKERNTDRIQGVELNPKNFKKKLDIDN